jgi:hypothetical protein
VQERGTSGETLKEEGKIGVLAVDSCPIKRRRGRSGSRRSRSSKEMGDKAGRRLSCVKVCKYMCVHHMIDKMKAKMLEWAAGGKTGSSNGSNRSGNENHVKCHGGNIIAGQKCRHRECLNIVGAKTGSKQQKATI